MARKITDNRTFNGSRIFKIKSYDGYIEFVECESLKDLHTYIALECIFKFPLSSITEIRPDGTTPRIQRLSLKQYKQISEAEARKKEMERVIREVESYMEVDYGEG